MSGWNFKYTLLLSSLPVHPVDLFEARQLPVSRIQLDKRLALLDAEDAQDLARIEALLHWSKMKELDDEAIVKQGMADWYSIRSPFLKEIVMWRLELRTILSALRRRRDGMNLAPDMPFYGFGDRLRFIRQHWRDAAFGLDSILPWVRQASELIEQDRSLELEKLMLEVVWRHYQRVGQGHYFDFPAVVIYVLKWDVISRWSSYDKEHAMLRFDELISAGLEGVSIEFG
ncbi:MAG: DUF2764 domain-containing protein [Gammaproteobacteria bacterium]|uniref:DUF2764 family protein n=1 Tax=Methylotuvimicrobium sp. TaxID=2822413 RepID=UPI001D58AE66|nr:DUF2764 domain-containing protein [Gammaproteobacteria bacterium]